MKPVSCFLVVPTMCGIAVTLPPARADCTPQQLQQVNASDASLSDEFARSVSIDADTAIIGAPFDDHVGGNNAGSAYVFVRSGDAWAQQAKLTASDAAEGDEFGHSVAISGDTIVVGAPGHDYAGGVEAAGSAYVFVRSGAEWTQLVELTGTDPGTYDLFGSAVAISGDTIAVGAYADDDIDRINIGSAYMFARSAGLWTQQGKLIASDSAAGDCFGTSVAVSGESVVVGAMWDDHAGGTDAGSAYVFGRTGGVWAQQARLSASDAAGYQYVGNSVAISGQTILVGAREDGHAGASAGSTYVFVESAGNWTQQAKLVAAEATAGDQFGVSVAVTGDIALIGASNDDHDGWIDAGSAYVFVRLCGVWTQRAMLTPADAATGDPFGYSVAISGQMALAGAHAHAVGGAAYVFDVNCVLPAGPGDVNCDGSIDFFDIDPFLVALFTPSQYATRYPDCDLQLADLNGDGFSDFFDIDSFLSALFGS